MKDLIEAAMQRAEITQGRLADRLHMSRRNLQRLIYGETPMSPDDITDIADITGCPTLTMVYCRQKCVIGKRYGFDLLNNVDLSPMTILVKYRQEEREAHEALETMLDIVINKSGVADCTDEELKLLWLAALEMLDLEHVIETLKLRLWDFINIRDLVEEHNRKCREKRYYDPEQPDLQIA